MRRYIILLISFVLLSCSPTGKYQNLAEVRSWEKDIQNFEQLDKSEKYQDDAILFAGSSSIRLWNSLEKDMVPYHVIRRGYGGAKLSDFAVYAGRIIDPHPCKAIVLFIANDITGTDQDKTPSEVAELFKSVLKIIRKGHPSTTVFWVAVTPTVSRWKVWPEIQKANGLIKKICENQKNTYFIKTDFAFLNENGLPKDELFREDKLHLTEKGYAVWTEIIKNYITFALQ
jgi:lysophospholipase L1-like esterase